MNEIENKISMYVQKLLHTVTAEEAAVKLGTSKPTVLRWAKNGKVQKAEKRREILALAEGRLETLARHMQDPKHPFFTGTQSSGGVEMEDTKQRLERLEGKIDALFALMSQQNRPKIPKIGSG